MPGTSRRRLSARSGLVVALAAATALAAGCSTKAEDGGGGGDNGDAAAVKTGPGIEGTTIKLGVLTDTTGFFAATGKDLTLGQQHYWEKRNAEGGICDTYTVELVVENHGYNAQNAVTQYSAIKDEVLAFNQILGSPMAAALSEDLEADEQVAIPLSWNHALTENPNYVLIGPTYDLELVNGLDFLLEKGIIQKGVKIGHIFHESEYGADASAGVHAWAEANGSEVVDQKIGAIDPADALVPRVTALKAANVGLVVFTGTPDQTAAIAQATADQGLNVPILGSGPTYGPPLLQTPAKDVLLERFYYVGPHAGLDADVAKPVMELYKEKQGEGVPANSYVTGYISGLVMTEILEKACADGDLTRAGVVAAKKSLTSIDTGGFTGPLDYSKLGESPTRKNFVAKPAEGADGGSTAVGPNYEGPTAATYVRR